MAATIACYIVSVVSLWPVIAKPTVLWLTRTQEKKIMQLCSLVKSDINALKRLQIACYCINTIYGARRNKFHKLFIDIVFYVVNYCHISIIITGYGFES